MYLQCVSNGVASFLHLPIDMYVLWIQNPIAQTTCYVITYMCSNVPASVLLTYDLNEVMAANNIYVYISCIEQKNSLDI